MRKEETKEKMRRGIVQKRQGEELQRNGRRGKGDTENRKNKVEDGSRREGRRRMRMKVRGERWKCKGQKSSRVVGRKGKHT